MKKTKQKVKTTSKEHEDDLKKVKTTSKKNKDNLKKIKNEDNLKKK